MYTCSCACSSEWLLTTHHSLLTTHHSLLTTHCSLLTTHLEQECRIPLGASVSLRGDATNYAAAASTGELPPLQVLLTILP